MEKDLAAGRGEKQTRDLLLPGLNELVVTRSYVSWGTKRCGQCADSLARSGTRRMEEEALPWPILQSVLRKMCREISSSIRRASTATRAAKSLLPHSARDQKRRLFALSRQRLV